MTQLQERSRTDLAAWDPENEWFWHHVGRRVARRNLVVSIVNEHIGISVFTLWSVLLLFLGPEGGFRLSPSDKFFLISTPTAVGAVLRLPYGYLVTRFGGRTWTVIAGLLLLVPLGLAAVALRQPGTPLWVLVLVAATAGLGGATFASSMCNIHAFYPRRQQGWALGVNAGGGNLGVASTQLAGLAVLSVAGVAYPEYLVTLYLPLIGAGVLAAALCMDNLPTLRAETAAQRSALRQRDTWLLSLLYLITFGSFIGYSFAFGLLLQAHFGFTALQAASLTFLGPLLGSLARPLGGRWADRWGGARVTLRVLLAMAAGTALLYLSVTAGSLPTFIAGSTMLIVLAGFGNGSTYRMIAEVVGTPPASRTAPGPTPVTAGAVIAIAGAVGALGGVAVNLGFTFSFAATGSAGPAFAAFLACYLIGAAVVWAVYRGGSRSLPAARTEVRNG